MLDEYIRLARIKIPQAQTDPQTTLLFGRKMLVQKYLSLITIRILFLESPDIITPQKSDEICQFQWVENSLVAESEAVLQTNILNAKCSSHDVASSH